LHWDVDGFEKDDLLVESSRVVANLLDKIADVSVFLNVGDESEEVPENN
jgi:hypothetical protein